MALCESNTAPTDVSLSSFDLLSQFSWSQIFAMIAVYYAELIAASVHRIETWEDHPLFQKPNIETIFRIAKDRLPEAHQALAYAEVLYDQEYLFEVLKTEKARKASIKRNQDRYSPLQSKIKTLYLALYQKQSARSAANKIYEELITKELVFYDAATYRLTFEGQTVLQTDDPVKQFEKWIGKFKKSIL